MKFSSVTLESQDGHIICSHRAVTTPADKLGLYTLIFLHLHRPCELVLEGTGICATFPHHCSSPATRSCIHMLLFFFSISAVAKKIKKQNACKKNIRHRYTCHQLTVDIVVTVLACVYLFNHTSIATHLPPTPLTHSSRCFIEKWNILTSVAQH